MRATFLSFFLSLSLRRAAIIILSGVQRTHSDIWMIKNYTPNARVQNKEPFLRVNWRLVFQAKCSKPVEITPSQQNILQNNKIVQGRAIILCIVNLRQRRRQLDEVAPSFCAVSTRIL
jgi:hypothetical protein